MLWLIREIFITFAIQLHAEPRMVLGLPFRKPPAAVR